jgi:hypothetical protein
MTTNIVSPASSVPRQGEFGALRSPNDPTVRNATELTKTALETAIFACSRRFRSTAESAAHEAVPESVDQLQGQAVMKPVLLGSRRDQPAAPKNSSCVIAPSPFTSKAVKAGSQFERL